MKRVRCPKCDQYITFDETKYSEGQSLVFVCPTCGKQFGIRIKPKTAAPSPDTASATSTGHDYGNIIVIENNYGYKQILPLHMGDNVIGRYKKNYNVDCPIETGDLNIDYHHCVINVSHDKHGNLKYELRDGPSYKGTYVDGTRLEGRERRVIEDGSVFTIGLTSVILSL